MKTCNTHYIMDYSSFISQREARGGKVTDEPLGQQATESARSFILYSAAACFFFLPLNMWQVQKAASLSKTIKPCVVAQECKQKA